MTSTDSPIAVLGATGQQGRAVVDSLLAAGSSVRALVRNPAAQAARRLGAAGAELVPADQEDAASLLGGLRGAAALFFMTTFADADGTAGEVRRGITVAEAAAAASVPHVVYSSVGGAERGTGIPHFESKRQVELRLRDLVPATFVRPTFFLENLAPQLAPTSGTTVVRLPLPGNVPLQMIAVRDVGAAAARLLLDPAAVRGGAVEIAGDEVTLDEFAATAASVLERDVRYEALPVAALGDDEDLRAMFAWFAAPPAYRADLDATRALVPDVHDARAWLTGLRTSSR